MLSLALFHEEVLSGIIRKMGGVLSLSPMVDSTKSSKMPRFLTFK